ncbi:MAG: 1-deoxy-D-xylulose-5-phosphate synthase, partial [Opitutaceae bacterium]|nr:1-deoxy-D-xylulose-5-phosphate synthase [Opitutaceae bacterium]
GFLCRTESEHDSYGAGHAGTALSAALGMATARDLNGTDEHVVALIGDASLSCGITMEALNNIASSTKRLVVILNDNKWSISKNVGALSKYLTELITNPLYNRLHDDLESFLKMVPGGNSLLKLGGRAKTRAKSMMVPSSLFEKYGLRYLGPIDGHNIELLTKNLEFAKHSEHPILLHVLTTKGSGYDVALEHPEKFHGPSPFDPITGKSAPQKDGTPPKYQDVFGDTMVRFAQKNPKLIGITAAMAPGTGLISLATHVPKQFFDVGIAEEHAVLFAAGLATKGFHPVCAIYSTFLQRAIDPIIHDVCLQNLPISFCMDRAWLSPNDGPTHHGLFDLALLRATPNSIIMQPKDEDELVDMMHTSFETPSPTFIRYPRGNAEGTKIKETPEKIEIGKSELLLDGTDIILWALGNMVTDALQIAAELRKEENVSVGVVNARFVKPLDKKRLLDQAEKASLFVTLEDHVITGGFGSALIETLQAAGLNTPVERIGWPDKFVEHGSSVQVLREAHGLSNSAIKKKILSRYLHNLQNPVEAAL